MNILLLNGSPRLNGNTGYALSIMAREISKNSSNIAEIINVVKLKVSGCIACDACKNNGGHCVMKDDSKYIIDKISSADMIIFGTPVYWWGVSSQLKAVIDKFYSKDDEFPKQNKKIGVISVGAGALTDKQYSLISDQFSCICGHLGWEKVLDLSFSALNPGDLKKSEQATMQLVERWRKLEADSE